MIQRMLLPALLLATLALGACASRDPAPVSVVSGVDNGPNFRPATLRELRGQDVLIFPDIAVSTAVAGVGAYVSECLAGPGIDRFAEPHGFRIVDQGGETVLRAMFATVSKSSAVSLDGKAFNETSKAGIAAAVQGQVRCAG